MPSYPSPLDLLPQEKPSPFPVGDRGHRGLGIFISLLLMLAIGGATAAQNALSFRVEGALSYGGARWQADLTPTSLRVAAGDTLTLDGTLTLEVADPTLDYRLEACVEAVLAFAADGTQTYQDDNGRAARLANGLPATGSAPTPHSDRACAAPHAIARSEKSLTLDVTLSLPITPLVPSGWYLLAFDGTLRVGDSEQVSWYDNRVFSASGKGGKDAPTSYAPLLVAAGEVASPRLEVRLFNDVFAADSRFYAPDDTALTALDAQRLPARYPVTLGLPALPVTWVGGQLRVQHGDETLNSPIAPDGSTKLTVDLRAYGEHTLALDGTLTDKQGILYRIDGTYHVAVAEPLGLLPNALTGTLLTLDTPFTPALRTFPALNGDVNAAFTLYALGNDGLLGVPTAETTLKGVLRDGLWRASAPLTLGTSGMLVATYRARAETGGSIWQGAQRAVYLVAAEVNDLARGSGGVLGDNPATRQTWFDTAVYPADVPLAQFGVVTPYHAGDVVYLPARAGFRLAHRYLLASGTSLHSVSNAWQTWQAAVGDHPALPMHPFEQASDVWLWLGGTLQAEEGKPAIAPYFSTVVTTNTASARVTPQGLEPLLTHLNQTVHALYWLTGARIGQSAAQGDALHLDGYSVPLSSGRLASLTLRAPDGSRMQGDITSGASGFVAAPPLTLTQAGVWRVDLRTRACAEAYCTNSAGVRYAAPSGGILGADEGFNVYVRSDDVPLATPSAAVRVLNRAASVTLTVEAPRGWTNTQAFVTVSSPLLLLEERALRLSNRQASYALNRAEWMRRVPMLRDAPLFITFAVSGTDENGAPALRTRTFTWHSDRLITTD